MRSDWTALPDAVTAGIAERIGGDPDVVPAPAGDHAEIASAVTGPSGTVFVKAASAGVQSLRYELTATKAIGSYAPEVLWHFEAAGWLVMGTEHLDGCHADLRPGSPDLDLLAAALNGLQATRALGGPWFTPAGRLGFDHPAMNGTAVVHSDLNPTNLIVTRHGLRIVDWAWATKAAPWVELALLVQWLIGSGHTPEQAEAWLAQFPAWASVDRDVIDHFAFGNAAKWSSKARRSDQGWVHDIAAWTAAWAAYRAATVRELRYSS
ncbi:phosphotransferase [Micromonospora globbae]|jgi:hypothetical protein|uniref:Aminoglycoside phosphotransferase n=1 Tax=Micromonospora globbae TaxID=1894969 RepID=A0A420EXL5_9ACTN|nr:phosphotransferase [Micromonospora globbae]RKF25454.1 aminoglycoside phosphotransferase [Micromonospora globbae]